MIRQSVTKEIEKHPQKVATKYEKVIPSRGGDAVKEFLSEVTQIVMLRISAKKFV